MNRFVMTWEFLTQNPGKFAAMQGLHLKEDYGHCFLRKAMRRCLTGMVLENCDVEGTLPQQSHCVTARGQVLDEDK